MDQRRRGSRFMVDPCVPSSWDRFAITWRIGTTTYEIEVTNPERMWTGVIKADLDGGGGALAPAAEAPGPGGVRQEVEAALAPAVYFLLSSLRRVVTSEQALALMERVYLSGESARELEAHLASARGEVAP